MNARDEFRNLMLSMKMLEGGFTEGDGISEMSYKSSIYLDLIALGGEMNVSSLAGIMRVSPSAVTRRLNILEDLGLVVRRRSEGDSRFKTVSLSERGEEVLREWNDAIDSPWGDLRDEFSDEEIDLFCRMLRRASERYAGYWDSRSGVDDRWRTTC